MLTVLTIYERNYDLFLFFVARCKAKEKTYEIAYAS